MSKVFGNSMVAHVWAQQQQEEGRSHNGNMSFHNKVLYSYSTPIARFLDGPGGAAVLVTSRIYSVTTSGKHMPGVHRALGYGGTFNGAAIFHVPHVGEKGFFGVDASSNLSAAMHAENLAYLVSKTDEVVTLFIRARDVWKTVETLAGEVNALDAAGARYARIFDLPYVSIDGRSLAAAASAKREARISKSNTPAAIAKREKAAAAREAKAVRAAELDRASQAERIAAWRNGEQVNVYAHDAMGGALLRVRAGNLETSQGASVPLDHAVRVFRFVKLCRERGEAWARNGRTLRVGHFQVDSVDAEGNFRAGCHLINWPEVEYAARAAGVVDEAAADTREAAIA